MQGTRTSEGLAAPLSGVDTGRLVFTRGATHLAIRVDGTMHDLYRARFEGKVPEVRVDGGTVTVRYRPSLHHTTGEITLAGQIPWSIETRFGMSDIVADLEDLELLSWEISGGASKVEARLPRPNGESPDPHRCRCQQHRAGPPDRRAGSGSHRRWGLPAVDRRLLRQREDRLAKPRLRRPRGPVRNPDRCGSEQGHDPNLNHPGRHRSAARRTASRTSRPAMGTPTATSLTPAPDAPASIAFIAATTRSLRPRLAGSILILDREARARRPRVVGRGERRLEPHRPSYPPRCRGAQSGASSFLGQPGISPPVRGR